MHTLLAAVPIALVVLTMTVWRWRAASAGLLGLAATLVIAVTGFGLGTRVHGGLGPASAAAGALLEALFTAGTILWIIFPALCIYELQARWGAFETLKQGLTRLTEDPRLLGLLVAWFFALFLEGVAGFGTPVALAAPILVGLGFTPVQAVTLALVGHAAGVSFGAVGTPVLPQMAATGLSGLELARPAGLLHAALGAILAAFLVRLAGDAPPQSRHWADGALAALFFFGPYLALAWFVGPELPTIGGAILGGAGFALVVRRTAAATPKGGRPRGTALLRAAVPYLVVVVLVLATRLVAPLREGLQTVVWGWSLLDAFTGRLEPLYHPGTLLLLGFVLGGFAQGRSATDLAGAAASAARRLVPVVVALLAMLGLSRLMVHAGMIQTLADAAAGTGAAWPFLAPLVGVLGTFVTGSATASNILFSDFQEATAIALGLPVATLQGGQNFGAAVGNMVCPHNIIAGGATVGLAGREGEVMRATALACLIYTAAGGLMLARLV
jgi:lactate permease